MTLVTTLRVVMSLSKPLALLARFLANLRNMPTLTAGTTLPLPKKRCDTGASLLKSHARSKERTKNNFANKPLSLWERAG